MPSRPPMIYLDNAATSLPKPPGVAKAVAEAIGRAGNPGRSGHVLSIRSARDLFTARERLAELFGFRDSSRFVFTENATAALNQAIKGLLRPGDHVVTTSVEHNAVMRPLRRLEDAGIALTIVSADATGTVDPAAVASAIRPGTRLVVVTHASNVSGAIQPVAAIVSAARARGVFTLIDAAQTAGSVPIDLGALPADMLAAAGHKGLLGPQGTGFLFVREGVPLIPLIEGGTGSRSEEDRQPEFYPDCMESGTPNSVGLAGLSVALGWLLRKGVGKVREHEVALLSELIDGMRSIPGIVLYGPATPEQRSCAVSFNVSGADPGDVCRRLERDGGILLRSGLHCSPNAHKTLGTFPQGTVRVSPGPFTTRKEIRLFLAALRREAT